MCDTKSMICGVNLRKLSRFWCSTYGRGPSAESSRRASTLSQSLMLAEPYGLWPVRDTIPLHQTSAIGGELSR